jgi:hypothetical protein
VDGGVRGDDSDYADNFTNDSAWTMLDTATIVIACARAVAVTK